MHEIKTRSSEMIKTLELENKELTSKMKGMELRYNQVHLRNEKSSTSLQHRVLELENEKKMLEEEVRRLEKKLAKKNAGDDIVDGSSEEYKNLQSVNAGLVDVHHAFARLCAMMCRKERCYRRNWMRSS
jgi:uncharacterized small protein (DUF1192 family)